MSATVLSHWLQAVQRVKQRVGGKEEVVQLKPESKSSQAWPNPVAGPPPPRQPPSSVHAILSSKANRLRKCQSSSQPGNLHAQRRSFLSWHSSSCGLCKDFPAFPSLSPLALPLFWQAALRQVASVQFFSPHPLSRCVSLCVLAWLYVHCHY